MNELAVGKKRPFIKKIKSDNLKLCCNIRNLNQLFI